MSTTSRSIICRAVMVPSRHQGEHQCRPVLPQRVRRGFDRRSWSPTPLQGPPLASISMAAKAQAQAMSAELTAAVAMAAAFGGIIVTSLAVRIVISVWKGGVIRQVDWRATMKGVVPDVHRQIPKGKAITPRLLPRKALCARDIFCLRDCGCEASVRRP